VKLSISLSEDDLTALDEFRVSAGLPSRSAAVQHAIRLLGRPTLEQDYAAAWADWAASGDAEAWDVTAGDGVTDAAR
jgi:hypothetical protein